jgi:hypothetical protein
MGKPAVFLAVLIGMTSCSDNDARDQPQPTASDSQQPRAETYQAAGSESPSEAALPSCVRNPIRCNKDYLAFAEREQDHARPVEDCQTLYAELLSLWKGGLDLLPVPEPNNESALALRGELLDALNIGFLLQKDSSGFRAPPPQALILKEQDMGSYRRIDGVLHDKAVGDIPILMALPKGKGPFPVVLALPGHGEVPAAVLNSLPPDLVTGQGMALLAIGMRAYDSQSAEHSATMALLCRGFSLMGLRVYEALVALEFITEHPNLANHAIGLVGHSGGSATLNLMVWLTERPRALITDLRADYFNFQEFRDRHYVLDETHPKLRELAPRINNLSALRLGVLEVPYGAPDGPEPLLDFLTKKLE